MYSPMSSEMLNYQLARTCSEPESCLLVSTAGGIPCRMDSIFFREGFTPAGGVPSGCVCSPSSSSSLSDGRKEGGGGGGRVGMSSRVMLVMDKFMAACSGVSVELGCSSSSSSSDGGTGGGGRNGREGMLSEGRSSS